MNTKTKNTGKINPKNIESIGVEIEGCLNNDVSWNGIIQDVRGVEHVYGLNWHGDGSIECTRERQKFKDMDIIGNEFVMWTYPEYLQSIINVYEALYYHANLRQNTTTGNHVHIRFKEPLDYFIATSPAFINQFQNEYLKAFSGNKKYVSRLENRFSRAYNGLSDIIDNQKLGSRYRAINSLSLAKHGRWTVEFRILPYADNPKEYKDMLIWLITTVDNLVSAYKSKLKPLGKLLKYYKEGVKIDKVIVGSHFIQSPKEYHDEIPGMSWINLLGFISAYKISKKSGLDVEFVNYYPDGIGYVFHNDLGKMQLLRNRLRQYNAYINDKRVLIPTTTVEKYNKELGEYLSNLTIIRKYFSIDTKIEVNTTTSDYSDSMYSPIFAVIVRKNDDGNISIRIGTGSIRSGGFVCLFIDNDAKKYVKDTIGLLKFMKEYILELKTFGLNAESLWSVIV